MEDRCVICGEIVPEGRQVCFNCTYKYRDNDNRVKNNHVCACCLNEKPKEVDHLNGVHVCQSCIKPYYFTKTKDTTKAKVISLTNQEVKADAGKPQLRLVPTEIINCIARVREFGNKKYKDSNSWKKVEKERYIDAMFRHLLKYVNDNKSVDEESGLPHLWHLACNVAFLCEMEKEKE